MKATTMFKLLKLVLLCFVVAVAFLLWAKSPVTGAPRAALNNEIIVYAVPANITPHTLTVMTYNLGYASGAKNNLGSVLTLNEVTENLDIAAAEISRVKPDIVCLEEIDFDSARSFNIDQLDYLAKAAGFAYAAYAVNWNKTYVPYPYWPPTMHFGRLLSGQAVLSRYPILTNDITTLARPPHPFWYDWFYLDRLAQKVTIELGGKQKLALWNVHLEAFHASTRMAEAADLSQRVNADAAPLKIIAGDFNAPQAEEDVVGRENAAYRLIDETGLQADLEFDGAFTFPSWKPIEKIDHVLFSSAFTYEASGTPAIQASDHRPVWVRLGIVHPR